MNFVLLFGLDGLSTLIDLVAMMCSRKHMSRRKRMRMLKKKAMESISKKQTEATEKLERSEINQFQPECVEKRIDRSNSEFTQKRDRKLLLEEEEDSLEV